MDFEIKDSGLREEFESGMVRDVQDDKTLYSLIFSGPMLERWAEHLTKGAKKYGPNNWLLASGEAELDRFRESAVRHFVQWLRGDVDEDHAAAVFFNINGAEYVKSQLTGYIETTPEDEARIREDYARYMEEILTKPVMFVTSPSALLAEAMRDPEDEIDTEDPQALIDLAVRQHAEAGHPPNPELEQVMRDLVKEGEVEPILAEDGTVRFRMRIPDDAVKSCDCDPAIYKLIVKNTDSPLDGRMVYGSYSKCNEEWYGFPPGTDPRQGGIVYDLSNDEVELVELVSPSIEALLDTP